MPVKILMPALSPTMTEGTLARWLKNEGDAIKPGDVIAEIETDKATMEVESADEGVLGKILVPNGTENVAVNSVIGLLLEEGEDKSALASAGGAAPAAAKTAPTAAPTAAVASAALTPTPAAAPKSAAPAPQAVGEGRVVASPLAKRMAEQAGLDLSRLQGSGPGGRIVKHDIEIALAGGAPVAAKMASAPAPAPMAAAAPVAIPPGDFEEVPLTNMRKTIARRLTEAKQTIPHFYLTVDIELDALLTLRMQLNSKSDAYKLSVNDFIIKACGLALQRVPDANAIWAGDKIMKSRHADVSVAVAIEGGLITPIIRDADRKGLVAISNEMKDFAARAKAGKLKPEEYQGGAFSLSNLGMYGIKQFSAVINPPQGSILAVGAGIQQPVVKKGALAVATVMTATLSCDHRVVDGAMGAEWLKAFRTIVEDPISLML